MRSRVSLGVTTTQSTPDPAGRGDPRTLIAERPMSSFQVLIIAVLFCLNALDGFDVLAIAFAAPGITKDWSLSSQTIGFIISVGLFANAAGSLFVAPLADRIGRRPMILLSLAAMTTGMVLCAIADNTGLLSAGRLVTGVGVGALIPCISALASEYSNRKYRDFGVIVMAIGFPVGGLVGGQASAVLLQHFDWRAVFVGGGVVTGLLVLAPLLLVPESIDYLLVRRPDGALLRINSILARLGQAPLAALPVAAGSANRQSIFDLLLVPALLTIALTVTLAYSAHSATLYYSLNWIPKIVVDLGLSQSQAASVAAWCSGGGIVGASLAAWLATKIQIRYLTIGALAGAAASLGLFAHTPGVMTALLASGLLLGAFLYAAQVSLYALMTRAFPVHVRATGVGFVTGAGRLGGIVSPLLSGYLLVQGLRHAQVSSFMALGSLFGALVLLATMRSAQPVPNPAP
jgi:benzoate transport